MLSKAVKMRRRINRESRKQPAWRTCMQEHRRQQLNMLRLQRNAVIGMSRLQTDNEINSESYQKNLEMARQLRHEQQHMTRAEYYAELAKSSQTRVFSMRTVAKAFASARIDRFEIEKKVLKKYGRVTIEQLRRRKVMKAQFANSLKNQ